MSEVANGKAHWRFDWRNDEAVLVQEQPATAVYTGDTGLVVIRQEGNPYVGEDAVVLLTPCNAIRIARALLAEAGEPFCSCSNGDSTDAVP